MRPSAFILFWVGILCVFHAKAGVLTVEMDDPHGNFDWGGTVSLTEANFVVNLMEGLYHATTTGVEPAIAKRMTVSKDGKTLTFDLDPKRKWSDGKPIYAQDFVYGWLRLLSPNTTSVYFPYLFDVENAEEYHDGKKSASDVGLSAPSDFTLTVKLKKPVREWEKITSFWPLFPVRKDQIEKYGTKFTGAGTLVSDGPYVYDSVENKRLTFKRNPYYPNPSKRVKEIRFVLDVPEDDLCKQYQKGVFQIFYASGKCSEKPLRLKTHKLTMLIANVTRFPTNEPLFRKAVFAAIDMKKALKGVALAIPTDSLYPSELGSSKMKDSFDLKAAKKALADSGVIPAKTKITILTYQMEPFQTIGNRIKAQLEKNLGLNVEMMALANREHIFFSGLSDYHFMLYAWIAKVFNKRDYLMPFGNDGNNHLNYQDPIFDLEVQDQLYDKAETKLLQTDAVVKPVSFEYQNIVVNPSVKGLELDHMGLLYFKNVTVTK